MATLTNTKSWDTDGKGHILLQRIGGYETGIHAPAGGILIAITSKESNDPRYPGGESHHFQFVCGVELARQLGQGLLELAGIAERKGRPDRPRANRSARRTAAARDKH